MVATMPDDAKRVDLVLEGGGVKGIALLGAVLAIHDAGYTFQRIAGTSAGAVVGALVAAYQRAGEDLHGLEDVMNALDYRRFEDAPWYVRHGGLIGEAVDVVLHGGARTGDYLYEWMPPLLERIGVTTFGDLRLNDPLASLKPYQQYSLVVHTSDLSRRVLVRLPWDYPQYDLEPDSQRIVDAVRASMSIPFYFRPVHLRVPRGGAVTWVDGALLSNFPITVFDRTDGVAPRWQTWGVKLSAEPLVEHNKPYRTGLGIAASVLRTLTSDWNRYHLEDEGVTRRTVYVDTSGVPVTAFELTPDARRQLYERGREAASRFLRVCLPR
jgi:NTE family protein